MLVDRLDEQGLRSLSRPFAHRSAIDALNVPADLGAFASKRLQRRGQYVCGTAVGSADEVRVGSERRCGIRVTETAGDLRGCPESFGC